MIKMAVKDTPTLLGNKLKQYYFKVSFLCWLTQVILFDSSKSSYPFYCPPWQGDNYFEIDVDVGSSSVARNVVGLAIGYSKAIVVDMGFCLQVRISYVWHVRLCGSAWLNCV